jgi:hypothetical protein
MSGNGSAYCAQCGGTVREEDGFARAEGLALGRCSYAFKVLSFAVLKPVNIFICSEKGSPGDSNESPYFWGIPRTKAGMFRQNNFFGTSS